MQSSSRPFAPVPRSPPFGPQNSVLVVTLNVLSLPSLSVIVKLGAVLSTDLTVPSIASFGISNFLSLPPPAAWRATAHKAITSEDRLNRASSMVILRKDVIAPANDLVVGGAGKKGR